MLPAPTLKRVKGSGDPLDSAGSSGNQQLQLQAAVLGKQSPRNVDSLINPEPCHLPGL